MKEQLVGYENLIEDLYRLQRETATVHGVHLAEARQEGERLGGRVRELEALLQASDSQLAEAHRKIAVLEERNQLLERAIQDYMCRLDKFLDLENRRLSTRIINFLFWSRGPRP